MREYPRYMSALELTQLVLALHTPVFRTDASQLTRRIHLYPQYRLQIVQLIELSVRFDDWSKDQRVLQYVELMLLLSRRLSSGASMPTNGMRLLMVSTERWLQNSVESLVSLPISRSISLNLVRPRLKIAPADRHQAFCIRCCTGISPKGACVWSI